MYFVGICEIVADILLLYLIISYHGKISGIKTNGCNISHYDITIKLSCIFLDKIV